MSCSVCRQGASGQRTSGPQLPELDHPQASSRLGGSVPAACVPQWPVGLSLFPLVSEGFVEEGVLATSPWGRGWSLVPRLPGACLTPAGSSGHYLPTLSSQGGQARKQCSVTSQALCPQYHGYWQWPEVLQHPLGTERGAELMGRHQVAVEECLGAQGLRGVGENGVQILALPRSIRHLMV